MNIQIKSFLVKALLMLCLGSFSVLNTIAGDEYNGRVKGKISTLDGVPAAWVSVQLEKTNISTVTDEDGYFFLNHLKSGKYVISISYTGLQPQEKTIEVLDGQTSELNFTIQSTSKQLAEIIIDGRRSSNLQPVSIGKVPIAPMDLPQSFTVIDQNIMRNQQAQKLSDVIKNVNGVYLSTTRASTQESFFARGYRLSGDNFFKNGVRVNSGVFPEISSLEKVEVLKGGAAILYGEVAPGGIINMITKQPKFNFGGEVSMRAGSYDLYKPSFDVYGPVSKKLAYRINGKYENAGSFRDNVHSEKYYINPSLLYNFDEKTSLLLQADYLNHDFTPDFGIGSVNNSIIADVPRSTFQGVAWQYKKINQTTVSATLKRKINDSWNLNITGSYQLYDRDYYSLERVQANAIGDWARPLNKIQSQESSYFAQASVTGKFKTGNINHTLLTGVDADRYLTTNYTFNNPKFYDSLNILDHNKFVTRTDIPSASKVTQVKTPVSRVGAYVQDLITISNSIKLLAGIRWSNQMAEAVATNYLAKDSIVKGESSNSSAFSPRVGLVYKPFANTAVFTSYSNSFSANKGTDVFGNALKASIIDQFELGIKNDFMNGALSVNITGYRIVNNNLAQTAQFEKDGITPNNNTAFKELVGQTTSDGIELDISGHPIKGFDIIAGYSYNKMRFTKTPDTKGSYKEGETLVGTPEQTANGSVFYSFSDKLKGLKIGASAFYTGDRFGGWNNTKGQSQNYSRLIPVGGFTTIDISAGYTFKKISVLAKVSNITNTYNYYVHENYSINPIPPTQLMGTVSYKF